MLVGRPGRSTRTFPFYPPEQRKESLSLEQRTIGAQCSGTIPLGGDFHQPIQHLGLVEVDPQ